jgi:hypothetical protein
MSDAHTVLRAPKLLDLTGVCATENAITLAARTSSRVARCPVCARDRPGSTPITRGRWRICPGKECLSPFACA